MSPVSAQRRKKDELPPAPPPVVVREVTVTAGESVVIPLGIHGSRSYQLEFLIRSRPRAGKLTAVTNTGLNSGSVTYSAPENTQITEDRFTYAARSNEGVSAPGIVMVRILPKPMLPGRIEVLDELTFPATIVGQASSATFDIRNAGGSTVSGEIEASAPWSVEGTASYRLEPKERATVTLRFRPEKAGTIAGDVVLGPNPRRVVSLKGEAKPPFIVKPDRLKLMASDKGQTRTAVLEIENISGENGALGIESSGRLMTEKVVEIAAGGKVQVPVFAEPGDGAAFQDVVRIKANVWSQEIPVEVEPLRRRLKLAAVPGVELRAIAGQPAEFQLNVENEGGRAVSATLTANPPFAISETNLTVGAGEKKQVKITATGLSEGEHPIEVTAETDSMLERLKLTYVVEPDPARPAPAPKPRAPMTTTDAVPALALTPVNAAAPGETPESPRSRELPPNPFSGPAEFPNGMGNFVKEVQPERAVLEWPATLGGKVALEVQERHLSMPPGEDLKVSWNPLANVTFQPDANPRRAELNRLQPAKLYTVRLRSGGETVFTAQFTTPPKKPIVNVSWRGGVLTALFIALGLIGWRVWKNRRGSTW